MSVAVIEEAGEFPYSTHGNSSSPVLVMVAGFPDDTNSAFGPENFDEFSKDYFVISLCLPGYAKKPARPWGYSFPELLVMLHKTIHKLTNAPFFLVGHDWGSLVVQLYQNAYPEDVRKLCLMDVGQDIQPTFISILYPSWFAMSYVLSQTFGKLVGNLHMATLLLLFRVLPINPTPNDKIFRKRSEINVTLCYPYYHALRAAFTKNTAAIRARHPTCPLLFMYGTQKAVNFHGPKFIERIKKDSTSKLIGVDAGHWLQRQNPQVFQNALRMFFK